LEILGKVYHTDAVARERGMTSDQRLKLHQTESAPLMDEMKLWLDKQVDEKLCEPNSDLGAAVAYAQSLGTIDSIFTRARRSARQHHC